MAWRCCFPNTFWRKSWGGISRRRLLVEPDERMADIARAHGVQVVVAPFEKCVLPRNDYDLVCSGSIPLGTTSRALVESHAQEMTERSDLITEFERRTFVHDRLVTPNDWVTELKTHSPIAMLDRATREQLIDELVQRVAASTGDRLQMRHETPCVAATRR